MKASGIQNKKGPGVFIPLNEGISKGYQKKALAKLSAVYPCAADKVVQVHVSPLSIGGHSMSSDVHRYTPHDSHRDICAISDIQVCYLV